MSEQVWMLKTSSLPLAQFAPLEEQWGGLEKAAEISMKYAMGQILSPDEFPKWLGEVEADTEHHENIIEAGGRPPKRKLFPLPVLFSTGLLFANAEAATILGESEMGTNTLHQLNLYARDLKTKYDQTTASWVNVAEMHSLMDAEQSSDLLVASRDGTRWMARDSSKVTLKTLPSVDLWRDPQLTRAVFVKDPLAQALMKQKGGKKLKFQPCRIIG